MVLSRRAFLVGASAAVAASIAPVLPAHVATVTVAAPAAVAEPLLAFAVGTPGDYDWQHIIAKSAEEAWRIWMEERGEFENVIEGEPLPAFDPEMVTRVEAWDGKGGTTSADWFAVGLGHVCDRCGYETSPEEGGRAVGDDAVCEGCLTWADRLAADEHDDIVDEIANRLFDEPAEDVRDWLNRERLLPMVDDLGLWAKALAA
jgi:hypothetical protein